MEVLPFPIPLPSFIYVCPQIICYTTVTCTASIFDQTFRVALHVQYLKSTDLLLHPKQFDNVLLVRERADHVDLTLKSPELHTSCEHLHSNTLPIGLQGSRRVAQGKAMDGKIITMQEK